MRALSQVVIWIDRLNDLVGQAVSLLTILMVLNVFLVVVLRYTFSIGFIWMQETYTWMHGIVFMLGAGYTLLHNGHVRIDVFYRTASKRYQAIVDLLGSAFLLMPLMWVVWDRGLPMVQRSWKLYEKSAEAGGLPGLFLLKTVILVFSVLFALQGLSMALRSILSLCGIEVPRVGANKSPAAAEGA